MSDKSECMKTGAEEIIGHNGFIKQNLGWDAVTLEEAVYQAVGAASVCWSDGTNGVFEDGKARNVAEQLLERIKQEVTEFSAEVDAQPKEWVERQEEERRAWAINSAIEYARHTGNPVSLTGLAEQIVDFVKGPETVDPDLHDQDSVDLFYVLYAEHAEPGLEYLRNAGGNLLAIPIPEEVQEAAEQLLDKMTKNGIRLRPGKTIDEVLAED